MVRLDELKKDQIARIVDIKCNEVIRKKFYNYGITEGCFVRMIYSHRFITAKINTKLFNMSKNLAEKIRVIKVGGY